MGNCLGRSSSGKSNNFSGQGRTLGDAPAPAPAPASASSAKVPAVANSPGRKLGSTGGDAAVDGNDPKTAAARAAEERMKASQKGGKLGKQLNAQKSKTQAQTLAQASKDNTAARDADAINETRIYE
ncbi:hypothetical protein K461DRAFT_275720 [Myriangium duriaei CBS 260.36]|uniref:Uncharacterized protein n=1 Tax=Myriangium duriaei CBS 260.36 TaxID=1168546 RepID=A0A9P4J8X8_9PEZI|nr:hypothetical protein K461DRAFT_275720 [Myriangium duriaei CBS 260.36]